MESLEVRRFLSASVVGAIPTQSVTSNVPATPITLGSYFKDTVVPAGDSVVEIKTNLPAPNDEIPLLLTDSATPQTVANFLHYITSGEYANSIIHRNATGFVLQGGQFYADASAMTPFGQIPSEASTATLHNTIGTLSTVLSSGPDSATDGFIINLANNDGTGTTANLNDASDGGPFTTFGKVIYNGLSVVNAIAALPIIDASSINSAWDTLPVQSISGGNFGPAVNRNAGVDGTWVPLPLMGRPSVVYPGPAMAGTTQQAVPVVNPNVASTDVLISEPASNLVVLNPQIVPGGLTYTVTSQNSRVATASIVNGQLVLTAGSAGTTKITVVATDLGGGTATQMFVVKSGAAQGAGGNLTAALASSIPASLIAGGVLPKTPGVRLTASSGGFNGNVSAAIVLSTTSNSADAVATLASTSTGLKLKSSAARTIKLTSAPTVPASLAAGTYRLLLLENHAGGSEFANTGKTITVKAPSVDLSGVFNHIPAAVKAGARTTVSFTISNALSASVTASGVLPYQLEASPDGLRSDAVVVASGKKRVSLRPGQHLKLSLPITLKQAGSEKLILVVDPNNAVFPDDSNAANNVIVALTATKVG